MSEKATEINQAQVLIPVGQVMNGFCYAYTKLLVLKLESLVDKDAVFKGGIKKAEKGEDGYSQSEFKGVATSVIRALEDQIRYKHVAGYPGAVRKLLAVAKEYLEIFEATDSAPIS